MKIDIITLFPDMFKGPFDMSMLWKAQERGLVEIKFHDLREFGLGPRRQVDDTPYGGGGGMLLKPEPIFAAIEAIRTQSQTSNPDPSSIKDVSLTFNPEGSAHNSKVIVLSPQGQPFNQKLAEELAQEPKLILVAGHYEGFDERILSLADYELCIGDYVLTGGELPAMVVVDAVVRLIPGVLGGESSARDESFSQSAGGQLDYPQYTRPIEFNGMAVPKVLQNGNHAEIAKWRAEASKAKTTKNRPDLLKGV